MRRGVRQLPSTQNAGAGGGKTMTVEQKGPLPDSNFYHGRLDPVDGSPNPIDSIVLHTKVGWIAGADGRFHKSVKVG